MASPSSSADNVLPTDPAPPWANNGDAPDLEAKILSDQAFTNSWDAKHRADLNLILTALSELIESTNKAGTGQAPKDIFDQLTAKKIDNSTQSLYAYFSKMGHFPADFVQRVKAHLLATKDEPHMGLWSAKKPGKALHDYSGLAAWILRDQQSYVHEMLASHSVDGPNHWKRNPDPLIPSISKEKNAIMWLKGLHAATPADLSRLSELRLAKLDAVPCEFVEIGTLLSEYKDNELRADSKFKGKCVEFTGKVGTTKKDITDTIYVTVGTGKTIEIPVVQCFFDDRYAKKAAALTKGGDVRFRGVVDRLLMNVLINGCEFVD